ncbi:hypothetical protein D3C78_1680360 [compost metagenome]
MRFFIISLPCSGERIYVVECERLIFESSGVDVEVALQPVQLDARPFTTKRMLYHPIASKP